MGFSARKIGIKAAFINYVLHRCVRCRGVKELCYPMHTYYHFVNNAISNLYNSSYALCLHIFIPYIIKRNALFVQIHSNTIWISLSFQTKKKYFPSVNHIIQLITSLKNYKNTFP